MEAEKYLIIAILIINLFSINIAFAQEEEYAWVLVQTKKFDGQSQVAELEKHDNYETDEIQAEANYQYGEGWIDYSATVTMYGKTASAKATISNGPDTIVPGDPVLLKIMFTPLENNNNDRGGGSVEAFLCKPESGLNDGGDPDFTDDTGTYRFESNQFNGFPSYDTKVKASIGAGKPGEMIAICARANIAGIDMGTNYIYEWKSLKEEQKDINWEVPKDESGNYIESGVKVNDVSGEVLIRHGDDRLGWEMLDENTEIMEGDIIMTKKGGSCILGLQDMTTFEMKPNAELIIITNTEKESKLKLLAGKTWANVKKIIKDGTMEIEMSQAVAGIKGTHFVLTETGDESKIEVTEGVVEFTSKNNNEKILINKGESVIATKDGLQEKTTFNPEELEKEMRVDQTSQSINSEDLKEKVNSDSKKSEENIKHNSNFLFSIIAITLIIGLIGAYIFLKRKKNR